MSLLSQQPRYSLVLGRLLVPRASISLGSVPCGFVAALGSRSRLRAPPRFVAPSNTGQTTGLSLPLSGPEPLWEIFLRGSCGILSAVMWQCSIQSRYWPVSYTHLRAHETP